MGSLCREPNDYKKQETRNTHIDELARESAAGFLCILVEIRQETQYSGSTLHVRLCAVGYLLLV